MTDEQTKQYVAALLRERQGYEAQGDADAVDAVDAELRRVGHKSRTPRKRAESRPAQQAETR